MKNVLVTGGSGFIGSHLIDKLKSRSNVVNYDIKFSKYLENTVYGDIQDLTQLKHYVKLYNIDTIFNLAGMLGTHELVDNAIEATKVNVIGTLNILEVCKEFGIRLVEISKPNCWVNTYTITKIAAESFVEMYRREFGVKAVVIKWFNVYGSRQPLFEEAGYTKFIPTAIVSALKGENITIYGNGLQTIDLIHTTDTVDATLSVVDNWDKCEGHTFEMGNVEISVIDCAKLINTFCGGKSIIEHIPMRKGETENTEIRANNRLLKEKTGYTMKIDLEEGFRDTISWYRKNYL